MVHMPSLGPYDGPTRSPTKKRTSGSRPSTSKLRELPERSLLDLASEEPRWERLLCDPDQMFSGSEFVGGAYQQYLWDVVLVMDGYDCCFRDAVVLAAKLDAEGHAGKQGGTGSTSPGSADQPVHGHGRERVGVADFLRARREGMPMHQALVFNMKAAALGPARAELCAWRRQEAKEAISKGQAAVELASSSLAKGRGCSREELAELGESLRAASELNYKLDYALEILEANSNACGEGDDVQQEYRQLFAEAASCRSGVRRSTEELAAVRRRKYPAQYVASRLLEVCARVCGDCPPKKARRRPTMSPPPSPTKPLLWH